MKKHISLFLIALVCIFSKGTPKNDQTNSSNIIVEDSGGIADDIAISEQVDSFVLASNKGRIGGVGALDGKDYDDFDYVWEDYYKILWEKWQANANRQKLRRQGTSDIMGSRLEKIDNSVIWDSVYRVLKKYYNIERDNIDAVSERTGMATYTVRPIDFNYDFIPSKRKMYNAFMLTTDHKGHKLIRFRSLLERTQIWFLISAVDGSIMATHQNEVKIMNQNEVNDFKIRLEKEEKLKKERMLKQRDNDIYDALLEKVRSNNTIACPTFWDLLYNFFNDNVNSIHLRKIDSVHYRKLKIVEERDWFEGWGASDTINMRYFHYKLKTKYNFPDNLKNIDSVTAVAIAITAMAECYSTEMTPFKALLMGNNKEHWMVYCFPTIPDNTKLQEDCSWIHNDRYERGLDFKYRGFKIGCPSVFGVLISKENGRVSVLRRL